VNIDNGFGAAILAGQTAADKLQMPSDVPKVSERRELRGEEERSLFSEGAKQQHRASWDKHKNPQLASLTTITLEHAGGYSLKMLHQAIIFAKGFKRQTPPQALPLILVELVPRYNLGDRFSDWNSCY